MFYLYDPETDERVEVREGMVVQAVDPSHPAVVLESEDAVGVMEVGMGF